MTNPLGVVGYWHFHVAVEQFRDSHPGELLTGAKTVCTKFLKTGSVFELDLDPSTTNSVLNSVYQVKPDSITPFLFDELQGLALDVLFEEALALVSVFGEAGLDHSSPKSPRGCFPSKRPSTQRQCGLSESPPKKEKHAALCPDLSVFARAVAAGGNPAGLP